jgi:hypothetical protein
LNSGKNAKGFIHERKITNEVEPNGSEVLDDFREEYWIPDQDTVSSINGRSSSEVREFSSDLLTFSEDTEKA